MCTCAYTVYWKVVLGCGYLCACFFKFGNFLGKKERGEDMGTWAVELDKQKVVDFLEECCDDTFLGDIIKAGEVRVASLEAHLGIYKDTLPDHEVEIKILLDVRRK